MEVTNVMKALAEETRLRILNLLKEHDLCVCELEVLLNISQSNASRHLNKLTTAGILEYYKVAKFVYYKINEDILKKYPFIEELLQTHVPNSPRPSIDLQKFIEYKEGGYSCDDLVKGNVDFKCCKNNNNNNFN